MKQQPISLNRSRYLGFTLIELMAALSIFSIMAIAAWQILDRLIDSTTRQSLASSRLIELQLAVERIDQDFQNYLPSVGIIDEFGLPQGSLSTRELDYQFSLSRSAWFDAEFEIPSAVQRVAYFLVEIDTPASADEQSYQVYDLVRRSWQHPDRTAQTPYSDQTILTEVVLMDLQFLSNEDALTTDWPNLGASGEEAISDLKAVTISLELEDFQSITRMYPIHPAWSRDEIGS